MTTMIKSKETVEVKTLLPAYYKSKTAVFKITKVEPGTKTYYSQVVNGAPILVECVRFDGAFPQHVETVLDHALRSSMVVDEAEWIEALLRVSEYMKGALL